MTQSLNALFSPETTPHPADLQPFRFLCDSLFFYALPDQNAPQPVQPGHGEKHEQCAGYTPVHLSDKELSRFLSLIRELKGHEAEFHDGFLASFSAAHGDRDEASAGSLAASMRLGPQAVPSRKAEDAALWQAMLILKLAEMLRDEQREIDRSFLALSDREAELFAAIRGTEAEESEEDDEEVQTLGKLAATAAVPSRPTFNLARLTKAWGYLYARDAKAAEIPLLVTTHEELHGLLAEVYETLTGGLPRQLVTLALPNQGETREDADLVEKFRTATGAPREHFNRLLLEIAAGWTISSERLTELQEAGNALNRAALPFLKNSPAEKPMRFYAYEGTPLRDLFAGLCRLDEPRKNAAATTGLLAVLG
jgi:hypothetical protein